MNKRWYLKKEKKVNKIDGLSPILLQILNNRGLVEEKIIRSFLYGSMKDLPDPYLLKDMNKAVRRIIKALENKEKIIVFGDFDVDGITATSLLYRYFKASFNFQVDYYIPDRKREGYGLNLEAIEDFSRKGYSLLLTVDCGITAIEEVVFSKKHGLDVIITDHHQAGIELPPALAVVDPHRKDDLYPYKSLAGVGVAFKLCQALEYNKRGRYISEDLVGLLDLITLGTVADIVPLTGENRIIVKNGLDIINNTRNRGLKELIKKVSLFNKKINTGDIGYIIAPHLNSAGRISDAEKCVKLLTTEDQNLAEEIAIDLKKTNKERQELEEQMFREAKDMVEKEIDLKEEKGIILASEKWHEGVIGIVASRLVELYYRPVILIAIDKEGKGKGSCRSIRNLDIFQALNKCTTYLEGFGGHKMAAGLTLDIKNLAKFKEQFNRTLDILLDKRDLIPELELDLVLEPELINLDLYEELTLLEPFGVGNPRPSFMLSNIKIDKAYPVGKKKDHLKFSLNNGINGIGFNFGNRIKDFNNFYLDLAFYLDKNEWKGKTDLQLNLKDYSIRDSIEYYPVLFRAYDYIFADKRGYKDFICYFKELLEYKKKFIVYINNLKFYQHSQAEIGEDMVYLAKSLSELERYQEKNKGILFFTNRMAKNILQWKKKDFTHDLVFLSLPFSLQEMRRVLDLIRIDTSIVHLLFSGNDLKINRKLIQDRLPGSKYLKELYLILKNYTDKGIVIDNITEKLSCTSQEKVRKSLNIFKELNIVDNKGKRVFLLPETGKKLDLSASISYNNYVNIVKKFDYFVELALARDLFKLMYKLKFYKEDMEWI